MDESFPTDSAPASNSGPAIDNELRPGVAAPPSSSSELSDPNSNIVASMGAGAGAASEETTKASEFATTQITVQASDTSNNVLDNININVEGAANAGTPAREAAKDHSLIMTATPAHFPATTDTPTRGGVRGRARGVGRGRGGGRPRGSRARGRGVGFAGPAPSSNGAPTATATSLGDGMQTPVLAKPRGRGRGGGRPRGGRGRGGGRGGKRKREDGEDDDDEDDDSDSSEVTPVATMTKSGRSVQKPTSFVPPPPSPINTNKRKRPYARRNPEAAVCKVCLRGTSPTTNMIVFCDGCNMPYHRYCHQPPIDQAVIDEVDKEWYCRHCESERVVPVPEAEVASFVSVEGATAEQRQRYFSKLAPGVLITLLTKVTTLHPDLPLFAPSFKASLDSDTTAGASTEAPPAQPPAAIPSAPTNGHDPYASSMPPPPPQPSFGPSASSSKAGSSDLGLSHATSSKTSSSKPPTEAPEEYYGPDVHPTKYPRPGQGLMSTLPPDKDDLQWLVEDDKFGVFTHLYQPDQTITDATATGHARADASGAGASV